ncbi:DUF5627 domain-containing protein [Mariniflexile sp. HNIBRBA6329]|uniref:DUF5627 domain-containing protein n=1 Tax=Mariniflexile sp. HNIBRBA6329 TaxID=3373088 RepID=UPI0037474C40
MKLKIIIIFAVVLGFMGCENQDIEFDDFGSTSVYFPFQMPIRTLILGEYDLGFNDNDNNGRFEIGVTMSGVYENKKNRLVYFELAPELIDATLLGVDSVNVQILPSAYYTIEQSSPVTIPTGSIKGRIPVQLTDAFFDDPLSFAGDNEVHYVIPLKITDYEELDSLLTGVSLVDNPIKIYSDHWKTQPKDYTLFGIKYMNKYQGIYLRRGEDKVVGTSQKFTVATGNTETTNINTSTIYKAEFVERDELTPVSTAGRNKAISTNLVRRGGIPSNSTVSLELTFNNNEEITITNADANSNVVITGSGKFVKDGDQWGGEKRDVIYLDYQYQDVEVVEELVFGQVRSRTTVDLMHTVKDTLVIRDRNVKFEEFTVQLKGL